MQEIIKLSEGIAKLSTQMEYVCEKLNSMDNRVQEKLNDHDERISFLERKNNEEMAIKSNHKAIAGFVIRNWKFILMFIGLVGFAVGSIDIALRVPSKDQQSQISQLKSQVTSIDREVKHD